MKVQISASSAAGSGEHPAVAGQPAVHQLRHVRLVLEEAHRGAGVVQEPAEPGVVEVDDADPAPVHQQVGQPGVRVHQPVPLRPGAERGQPGGEHAVEPAEHLPLGRADPDPVLPASPARRPAERRVVVPAEPGEPGRPGPLPGVPVHPRGDLAQLGEVRGVVVGGLGAGQVLEPDAVPLFPGRLVGQAQHAAAARRPAAPAGCAPRPRPAARPSRPARRRSRSRCGTRAGAPAGPTAPRPGR